jgi:hypothetical protein
MLQCACRLGNAPAQQMAGSYVAAFIPPAPLVDTYNISRWCPNKRAAALTIKAMPDEESLLLPMKLQYRRHIEKLDRSESERQLLH